MDFVAVDIFLLFVLAGKGNVSVVTNCFSCKAGDGEVMKGFHPNKNNFGLETKPCIMYVYDTVTEAVNGLKKREFTLDFNLQENCLVCQEHKFDVNEFEIVEVHRFEGNTDPADEAVVYAIQSATGGLKGVLVNGYGVSAGEMSGEMAKKLEINRS